MNIIVLVYIKNLLFSKVNPILFHQERFTVKSYITTRKLINTNGNTKGIFLLVNCQRFYRWKYSLGIYWENYNGKKIIKTKQKKWWRAIFTNEITNRIYSVGNSVRKIIGKLSTLFIMLITKGITDGTFCRYFTESSGTIHFPIALLITIFYRQNHRRIEKSLVLFGGFLKNLN